MVGFMGKRKELEQVVDGLSDFSLSGPAAKSRRLDPGLPPIMEEELSAPSISFQHEMLGQQIRTGVSGPRMEDMTEGVIPSHISSEDKALVLYKPPDNPVFFGPGISNHSIIVSSDLIRGLKNQAFDQGTYHGLEDNSPEHNNSLAIVPWVPQQTAVMSNWSAVQQENTQGFEVPMEADDTEVVSMDVEEVPQSPNGGIDAENLHQWQQHCMTPPSLPNPSAHVMWSR